MALVLAANFEFAGCEKQKIMRLMTMSVETVRMAKSRPRKNQSQCVDCLKTTVPYLKITNFINEAFQRG